MAELRRITLDAAQRHGDRFALTASAQHYLQRVLRLSPGDRCIVTDGCGGVWEVELEGEPLGARIVAAVPVAATELSVPLVLVAAVPKGSGFDAVVRQTTELGVAAIVPVVSDRTILEPSPKRVDRWRRIATEACEQCERAAIPHVLAPQRFDTWLKTQPVQLADRPFPESDPPWLKAIAVARSEAPSLSQYAHHGLALGASGLLVAIGPEGGWTPREHTLAIEAGFRDVSLGNRILRAVTASVAAVAIAAAAIESM